jgi:hypothetical protein
MRRFVLGWKMLGLEQSLVFITTAVLLDLFQQSLVFTDGGSNRSEDAICTIREACRGAAFNPACVDDPRCSGDAMALPFHRPARPSDEVKPVCWISRSSRASDTGRSHQRSRSGTVADRSSRSGAPDATSGQFITHAATTATRSVQLSRVLCGPRSR